MSDKHKPPSRLKIDGREYVVLAREEYDRLTGLARVTEMPRLPEPDGAGNYPAVEYARASIARDLVKERMLRGLTQRELARLAGLRFETVCRIEKGRHTASTATLSKIERALAGLGRKKAKSHGAKRRRSAS